MIERIEDFYEGTRTLYAVHSNGKVYAIFAGANEALAYWRGLDAQGRRIFHVENEKGQPVTVEDLPGRPGHAYTILDSLA